MDSVTLLPKDIPGAMLQENVRLENHSVKELKRWLECRSLKQSGSREELIKRIKDCIDNGGINKIFLGLDLGKRYLDATCRPIPKEPVPFKEILPLKLRDTVSGKGGKTSDVCCIYEMSVMFACFKDNEFNQALCSKEIESFKKCYKNNMDTKVTKKEKEAKGVLNPGEKKMSHKQLNTLLKRFPNI